MTSATPKTDGNFSFTHDGKRYVFEKSFSVIRSPRWLSENRRRDETDLAFTMLEELAGDEAYEAILSMDWEQFKDLQKKMQKEMSATFS